MIDLFMVVSGVGGSHLDLVQLVMEGVVSQAGNRKMVQNMPILLFGDMSIVSFSSDYSSEPVICKCSKLVDPCLNLLGQRTFQNTHEIHDSSRHLR